VTQRIYMIRHARPASAWGGGEDDPGLDPEGVRQALAACRTLMDLPAAERPARIVSSPLRRCRETAQPLAETLAAPVEVVAEVGEIPTPRTLSTEARGPWLRAALAGRWSDIRGDLDYEAWRRGVHDAVLARPGAAIFSHFVAINAIVSLLAGRSEVISFRPDHAAITVFEVEANQLKLAQLGREAVTGVL
jgi:broad specificity phosphatase PhoE